MHPWLLHSPPVSTYGACIVAALIAAWLWARRRGGRGGIDASRIDLLMPVLVAAGLLGAWSFGLLTDTLTHESAHGTVLIGSLLLATAAAIAYAVINRIPLGILGDLCAPPLALGIAIGRIGCFFAGCCYGKVCSPLLGITFPRDSFAWLDQLHQGQIPALAPASLPVYPTQLLESALCAALALFLWRYPLKKKIPGEQFLALGILYALIRFAVEFLRADNPPVFHAGPLSLTFSQLAALPIIALAAATWIIRRHYAHPLGLLEQPTGTPASRERGHPLNGPASAR